MLQPGAESVPWQNGMNRRPAYAFGSLWLSKITNFDNSGATDMTRDYIWMTYFNRKNQVYSQ